MQITPICVVCADSGNTREAARNGGSARVPPDPRLSLSVTLSIGVAWG
jgi:hypothetical protein